MYKESINCVTNCASCNLFIYAAGNSGHVTMDEKGDREPDYWMWFYGPDQSSMTPWMEINTVLPPTEVDM